MFHTLIRDNDIELFALDAALSPVIKKNLMSKKPAVRKLDHSTGFKNMTKKMSVIMC